MIQNYNSPDLMFEALAVLFVALFDRCYAVKRVSRTDGS